MLYSYRNSYPEPLPDRIVLSDGNIRSDRDTFTPEELLDAGYVLAPDIPDVQRSETFEWINNSWIIRPKNEAEKQQEWRQIQNVCLQKLQNSDFRVLKSIEMGVNISQDLVEYRQSLRNLYNNVDNIEPWNVVFPKQPF